MAFLLLLRHRGFYLSSIIRLERLAPISAMDLENIIHCADRDAHTILIALCQADFTVRSRAHALLVQLSANGNKRKATDEGLRTCIHCDEEFDEDENTDAACWYHEGKAPGSLEESN